MDFKLEERTKERILRLSMTFCHWTAWDCKNCSGCLTCHFEEYSRLLHIAN